MGMVDGHGAFQKEEDFVGSVRVSKLGGSMAMGPLRRKKTFVVRVRVSKW